METDSAQEDKVLELESILSLEAREEFAGLDNDALDFSQLEDFIANEADANGSYFADTLANSEASKHANQSGQTIRDRIIVVTNLPSADGSIQFPDKSCPSGANPQRLTGYANGALPHNLPDSPPDSGSEPPYSPTDPGSRSPNHKGSNIDTRRNLHDLLIHPLYPQTPSASVAPLLPLLQHDLPSISSPLHNIHVPSLIPISPPVPNSNGGSANSVTLTPNPNTSQLSETSESLSPSHQGPQDGSLPFYTTLETVETLGNGEGGRGRKRKASGSGTGNKGKIGMVHVKQEPASFIVQEMSGDSNSSNNNSTANSCNGSGGNVDDEFYDLSNDPSIFMDPNYQCIKFQPFQDNTWHTLADEGFKEIAQTYFKVDADKGFNFSNADDAFVCQKKNHFQITCHVRQNGIVKYVKSADGYKPVENFYVHFYGVKAESPNQCIKIEQSQSDRSKKPFHPVPVDVNSDNVAKLTVGRLHFNETTSNNMRKKGKPNPDQRYFYLVVALHAHCPDGSYPIMAQSSQRIIVRASNPGQFESDMELSWQKGHTSDSIYHAGRVGINMDRPEEALVVYGNCKITGQIIHPSDMRAKEDITEVDSKEQLKNVQQLRVVRYKYNPEFARLIGLADSEVVDTGIIAQEVQKIIPDAVKETGDIDLPSGKKINNFLVVNKERIFMENIGAVKELCKVTGKLETRIDHLEKITSIQRDSGTNSSVRSNRSDSAKKSSNKESITRTTEYLCSNRCVQLLIVILVLIMAFCLVAMATLYMLEYHKRSSYDYHHHSIYNASHEFPSSEYRHGGYGSSSNPSTYYPAPVHPHSFNPPTKNPKLTKSSTSTNAKSIGDSEPYILVKPKVLGKPQYCFPSLPYLDTHCGTFCCAGSAIPGATSDYLDIERKNALSAASSTRIFTSPPTSIPQNNNSEDAISSFSNNPVHRNGLDSKRRRRRQIDENPKLITVPSIRILSHNINQSLDSSYCMINSNGYHDCVSTENRYFSSANLTYHVPLSKYWDELNVQLAFRFSARVNMSRPKICHKFHDQPYCRLDDSNNLDEKGSNDSKVVEGNNTFFLDLNVGGSPYSRFNIRFSSNVEDHEELCTLRKNIFEFNFHFYRVCHE